jgi:hypothetical protein
MSDRRCRYCQQLFQPSPYHPGQFACRQPDCQGRPRGSGGRGPTIPGGAVTGKAIWEACPWPGPLARRRWPRPPLRLKRSALRAPQGCAPAEANDLIQLRQKLKREEQQETKYEKDKKQKGDTSNRIRMRTFLIGLDINKQNKENA